MAFAFMCRPINLAVSLLYFSFPDVHWVILHVILQPSRFMRLQGFQSFLSRNVFEAAQNHLPAIFFSDVIIFPFVFYHAPPPFSFICRYPVSSGYLVMIRRRVCLVQTAPLHIITIITAAIRYYINFKCQRCCCNCK